MTIKIGDTIRIKIHKPTNGWLSLVVKNHPYSSPPPDNDCFYAEVQVCGKHQMNRGDYIALVDFDPHSYFSFTIEEYHQKGYDVSDKFLGMKGCYISDGHLWPKQTVAAAPQVKLATPGGCHCKLCKNFTQYAAINRDDGTFVCRKCRTTKGWMLKCKPLVK